MHYAAYLLRGDVYEDLEQTIDAPGPREAAQMAFDQLDIHADEEFPQLMVVPADQVEIFTRDDVGRARTITEDLFRMAAAGPRHAIVTFDDAGSGDEL